MLVIKLEGQELMQKKKLLLKLVFLLLVFVVGCRGGGQITNVNIYKGTDGLTMEFLENTPPDEVFENAIVPLGISIRNEGAYDIIDGFGLITFSVEEDYMKLNKESLRTFGERINWEGDKPQIKFSLNGKTLERAEGEHEIITLRINSEELEELSQIHESSILATACYGYRTELVANVCIDTDIYNIRGIVKSCKVKDQSYSSQGAPIVVANINTEMIPMESGDPKKVMLRPQFLIYIQNRGNGLVIEKTPGTIRDACSEKSLDYSKWNTVSINVYLGGDKIQVDCDVTEDGEGKTGIIKLRDNMGVARCILEEGIDEIKGTYVSPLRVVLDYGYTNTISKKIVIKKLAKY